MSASSVEAVGSVPLVVLRDGDDASGMAVMIAGLRTAAVTTISLATIAAWIGAGGLGTLLFEGITRNDPDRILAGAIAITTLAVLTDALLRFVESRTAIRRAQAAAR